MSFGDPCPRCRRKHHPHATCGPFPLSSEGQAMSDDIKQRLRRWVARSTKQNGEDMEEAANHIEALEARVMELEMQSRGNWIDAEQQAQLVRELEARVAELEMSIRIQRVAIDQFADERDAARAEAEALRKDAERYRWLRDNAIDRHWDGTIGRPQVWYMRRMYGDPTFDAVVDAAREGGK